MCIVWIQFQLLTRIGTDLQLGPLISYILVSLSEFMDSFERYISFDATLFWKGHSMAAQGNLSRLQPLPVFRLCLPSDMRGD